MTDAAVIDVTVAPPVETDDQVLDLNQAIKRTIINIKMKNGVPADNEDLMMVLSTINSMDKVALGRKKINVESQLGNLQLAASAGLAQLYMQAGQQGSTRPFVAEMPVERELPTLSQDIPEPEIVEGEMDIDPQQMDFETFTAKHSKDSE